MQVDAKSVLGLYFGDELVIVFFGALFRNAHFCAVEVEQLLVQFFDLLQL